MRYPWAVPGAKVVCVDASNAPRGPNTHLINSWNTNTHPLIKGETYTIGSVLTHPITHAVTVKLVGVFDRSKYDYGYYVGRFRPLHTQGTDVALFAHLLTPSPNSPMLPTKELTHQ